jgi:hypothetical protein
MRHGAAAIVVALALAASAWGCGGDDDGTPPDGSTGGDGGGGVDGGPLPEDGGPLPEDGGPPPADGGACGCIGETLEFGDIGGKVIYSDASSIMACRTFTLVRTDHSGGGGGSTEMCSNEVPCLGDATTIDDVLGALGHADVAAAFAAAPILYGEDSRPVDGTVFRVSAGGKEFLVGDACGSGGGIGGMCIPIPEGVQALVTLLRALEAERRMDAPCSTVFPPP